MRLLLPPFSALIVNLVGACAPPSNGTAPPDVVVRLAGRDCRPGDHCSFDFGAVGTRSELTRAFDIINRGASDADVTNVAIVGDPIFRLSINEPNRLSPGDSLPFAISATPLEPVTSETTLVVSSTASNTAIRVRLTVEGTLLGIQVTPHCDFGDVDVGATSAPCRITLTNPSETDAVVDGVFVNNDVFSLVGSLFLPVVIGASGSTSFSVVARPVAQGPANGSVDLQRGTSIVSGATSLRVNGL